MNHETQPQHNYGSVNEQEFLKLQTEQHAMMQMGHGQSHGVTTHGDVHRDEVSTKYTSSVHDGYRVGPEHVAMAAHGAAGDEVDRQIIMEKSYEPMRQTRVTESYTTEPMQSYQVSSSMHQSSHPVLAQSQYYPAVQQHYGHHTSSDQRLGHGAYSGTAYELNQGLVGGHSTVTAYYQGQEYTVNAGERVVSTRVIGHRIGQERIISSTEHVDESMSRIISEKVVETEITVPKKIIREEIYEKIIVVPEKVMTEEIVHVAAIQKERVIERSKPIIVETVVEVPEFEEVEVTIEVPEKKYEDRISYRDVEEVVERRVEVIKPIHQQKIVEVPVIEYREVPYQRIVEVHQEEIVTSQIPVPVPQYVEKPYPQYVDREVPVDVIRKTPVAVEAVTEYEFKLPSLRPRYTKVTYPVYLPRFIEVPISAELIEASMLAKTKQYESQLHEMRATASAMSLCEIENLAALIKREDVVGHSARVDVQASLMTAWQSGTLMRSSGQSYNAQHQTSSVSMAYPAAYMKTSGQGVHKSYETSSTRTYNATGGMMTNTPYTTSSRPTTPRLMAESNNHIENTYSQATKSNMHIASVVSAGGEIHSSSIHPQVMHHEEQAIYST